MRRREDDGSTIETLLGRRIRKANASIATTWNAPLFWTHEKRKAAARRVRVPHIFLVWLLLLLPPPWHCTIAAFQSNEWSQRRRRRTPFSPLVVWQSPSSSSSSSPDGRSRSTSISESGRSLPSRIKSPRKKAPFPLQKQTVKIKKKVSRHEKWNDMYSRLKQFHQRYGHSLVDKSYKDKELYHWTHSLRRNYRHQAFASTFMIIHQQKVHTNSNATIINVHGVEVNPRLPRLSPYKMEQLHRVHFVWDVQEWQWHKHYRHLQDFYHKHGHVRVPAHERNGLGVWVRNQRRDYRYWTLGRPSLMTPRRLQLLRQVDFTWYQSHADAWNTRYDELKAYYQTYNHSNVPEDYAENFALGQWCMNQRTSYKRYVKGQATALTPDRIQKLEQLEFRWNFRDHKWYTMLERLKHYYRRYGHLTIAMNDKVNEDLSRWLRLQRYHYNRLQDGLPSSMTEERVKAVESAIPGFAWKARASGGPTTKDWSKLFEAMRKKGIQPGMRAKRHWFEGTNPFQSSTKEVWTEQDLLDLWNAEDDDDDEEDEEGF
jgi:hypothetical protein